MHELSIAVSLVESAQEEAVKHHASGVTAVHLRLGPLSGVVKEALLFSYGLAVEGTSLQGSELVIEETEVVVFCPVCCVQRPIRSLQSFCCATCSTPATEVVGGRELELVGLEIQE